jgi:hypothetical protein
MSLAFILLVAFKLSIRSVQPVAFANTCEWLDVLLNVFSKTGWKSKRRKKTNGEGNKLMLRRKNTFVDRKSIVQPSSKDKLNL